MICRTCEEREAHLGKHDCDRCLPILKRLDELTPDIVRAMARDELFPARPGDAEVFAHRVDLDWHWTEVAEAIRNRACLWDGDVRAPVLIKLSGLSALTEGQIQMLEKDLVAVITRGTETDTLLINWGEP